MPRLRRFIALAATATVCLSMTAYAATAGVPSQTEPSTTTTTSPAPPPTTTTTADTPTTAGTAPGSSSSTTSPNAPPPVGGITQVTQPTTTTTQPNGSPGFFATTTTSTTTALLGGDGGSFSGPRVLPPGAQEQIDAVVRTPPNSSVKLIAALQPLIDMGMPEAQAYALGFGRFPVAGLANFSDDWLYPRFDGYFHFHHGTDVFAVGGLPARAPADGVMRQSADSLGGTTVYVTEPDGTYYYLAHLSAYVEGQVSGQLVKTGEVVGYVGNTGDAQGGATHVHFEVHPGGGGPVDPKPYLDQWLDDALAAVPALIAGMRAKAAPASASNLRLPSSSSAAFAAPAVPARSQ